MYDARQTAAVLPRSCATTRIAACSRRVVSRSRLAGPDLPQQAGGEDARAPGAEVLHREVVAGDLAQVLVHVLGAHVALGAELVDVPEQLLARQVLAAAYDPRQPPVDDPRLDLAAVLRTEREADVIAPHGGVPVAHRGCAERVVQPRVLVVADPQQCRVDQPQHGRQHLLPRQAAQRHVAIDPPRGWPGGQRRRAPSGRTSSRRAAHASAGGSGTACARARRGRWRAGARSGSGRSRRRARRAGWRAPAAPSGAGASLIGVPSGARYEKPRPARHRVMPGRSSVT